MDEEQREKAERLLTIWASYDDGDSLALRRQYRAVAFGAKTMLMALGYFVSYTDGKAKISQ